MIILQPILYCQGSMNSKKFTPNFVAFQTDFEGLLATYDDWMSNYILKTFYLIDGIWPVTKCILSLRNFILLSQNYLSTHSKVLINGMKSPCYASLTLKRSTACKLALKPIYLKSWEFIENGVSLRFIWNRSPHIKSILVDPI